MKKKTTALLLSAALMISCLAACGKEKEANAPLTTSEPEATVSVTPVPTDTPTPTPTPTDTPTPTPAKFIAGDTTYTTSYEVPKTEYAGVSEIKYHELVAYATDEGVLATWRYLPEDEGCTYILRKINDDGTVTILYKGTATNYLDPKGKAGLEYNLYTVKDTSPLTYDEIIGINRTLALPQNYCELQLVYPWDTVLPGGKSVGHTANDMSIGDLDGDGQLEFIVKWDSEETHDNSQTGYTGTTILDAYNFNAFTGETTLMWRIDLGINIRSGAHYTQFQVWDYDGDGIAEVICKTADGTTTYDSELNETGHVGAVSMASLNPRLNSKKQEHDYRNYVEGQGYILAGPEYLTAFDGKTGMIIDSVDYVPSRGPENAKGVADISSWGDKYGNRVDRFLAATAYIDDGSPAAIFCRGYYARTALTAWKLVNKKLTLAWTFDAPMNTMYAGQGDHGLSVNDVDNDGFDEIIYGSLVIDNDGTVLNCTGLGHGDAMHVSDFNNDGRIEVFQVHENAGVEYQIELHDAETGEVIWGVPTGKDTGRGMAADIDPRYPGAEMWGAVNGDTFDCNGNVIYKGKKPSVNFSIFWDGDLLTELFDHKNYVPEIQKWDYKKEKSTVLLSAKGTTVNNGTKANPCLIADIFGDWREEVILRCTDDPSKIRIYFTTYTTEYSAPCLLLNRAYREGIAWQNTAYNQPANLDVPLAEYVNK